MLATLMLMACDPLPPTFIAEPPTIPQLPEALIGACQDPVTLPDGDLTQAEVNLFWARDRVSLIECGSGKAALVQSVQRRDAALRGENL